MEEGFSIEVTDRDEFHSLSSLFGPSIDRAKGRGRIWSCSADGHRWINSFYFS